MKSNKGRGEQRLKTYSIDNEQQDYDYIYTQAH